MSAINRQALLSVLVQVFLLLGAPRAVQAQFSYVTNAGTITIIYPGYSGPTGAVTIPATINGLPVTSIGTNAFYNCNPMTSLTIPGNVTSISYEAFEYCHNLTNVVMSNGVTSIGIYAFYQCYNLTSVTIPDSVTNIGEDTFYYCSSLTNVSIPGSVTGIGELAFFHCSGLTNVTMCNGVASIGEWAFQDCTSLTSATIPGSVTNVVAGAFQDCTNLTAVYFQGNAPIADSAFPLDTNATVYYLPGTSGWSSPFAGLPAVMLNPPIPNGSLQVTVNPAGVITDGAQWQVDSGTPQGSGAIVLGLSVGNHTVSFSTVSGWITPSNQTVSVSANSTATASGTYVPPIGSLQVTITPVGAIVAGAKWQVDGGAWQSSADTVSNLTLGSHTVAFASVTGWTAPSNQAVTISPNQTTSTMGIYTQQFGSLQVNISPASAVSEGAQWQVDGGAWQDSGTILTGLTLGSHWLAFSIVPGWGVPGTQIVTVNFNQTTTATAAYLPPEPATATAIITNGFVVAVTITDSGVGYTNTPLVYVLGGGGSGAQAIASVSNGVVTGITITNAGSGYTNTPIISITPPFPLMLDIAPATCLAFTNLSIGTNYQLQVSASGTWNNLGSSFVAGASDYWQYFDASVNGSLYRLVALPIPYGATATAILDYGFVVAATVNDGGSGYVSVPAVEIAGGGGSGALATATVSNGVVTAINIIDAGLGYTIAPIIQIDPPPIPVLLANTSPAFRLDYSGLTPMLNYQLQASPNLAGWTNFGVAFAATGNTNSQYLNFETGTQFFRVSLP
ncbi:MAG: leucine-rich repeat domain-containing protein [Verrucomicrobiota bacterium]|jgi:hypothetical protein